MNYWDNFASPCGFSHGEAIPADAEEVRIAYVTALNTLAEYHGSAYRVVAWNAWGSHNFYRVLVARKADLDAQHLDPQCYTDGHAVADQLDAERLLEGSDYAWRLALYSAMSMNLDDYVDARVTLDMDGLNRAVSDEIRRQEARCHAS